MMELGVIQPIVQWDVLDVPFSSVDATDEGVAGGSSENSSSFWSLAASECALAVEFAFFSGTVSTSGSPWSASA